MILFDGLVRGVLNAASRGRLSVLIYHRVLAERDELMPGEPDAAEFERTLRWVKSVFNVIPLADGLAGIKSGKLPSRALSITFDDGYANNATVAAPILHRLGLHATFFIATGFLDGGRMFNDTVIETLRGFNGMTLDLGSLGLGSHSTATLRERGQAVDAILRKIKYEPWQRRAELAERVALTAGVQPRSDLMMTSGQVAGLARAGFAVGGHTVNHPILAQIDAAAARDEIARGRARLEELSGARVGLFAYPNGQPGSDYDAVCARMVRELEFDGAVSTSRGAARVGSDPFQVPRFTPWDVRPVRFASQVTQNIVMAHPAYVTA